MDNHKIEIIDTVSALKNNLILKLILRTICDNKVRKNIIALISLKVHFFFLFLFFLLVESRVS